MLDGNGLGPLDSALGVWLKIPETLHQWLWMGKGSFVWDWGRLQPQCMHPTQQFPGTREPQQAPRPTMHSCSGRHLAQGDSRARPGNSLPPTPRDRHPDPGMDATPPRCPRCAGRWPPPSIWGQAGDRSGQPSSAKCEGQPSPRPVVALQAFGLHPWLANEHVLSTCQ